MKPTPKVPIVLMAALFVLAAVAEMAMGRSRSPQDDDVQRVGRIALVSVDEALAHGDTAAALRAWQQAYEAARMNRGWRGLVEAADAGVRIEVEAPGTAAPRARSMYLAALDRARAERSVEGTVRVAEGFSRLGDREVTDHVLRLAAFLAVHSGDIGAPTRVETARGRLLNRASSLTPVTV
jgi:hypothetical protein